MQERVTDMTKRLALAARLLLVAAAFLFFSSPGDQHVLAEPANARAASAPADERRLAADLDISTSATADLVASSSPPASDGEGDKFEIEPRARITGINIDAPGPGYVLPHGELLATAFAPRGPPLV